MKLYCLKRIVSPGRDEYLYITSRISRSVFYIARQTKDVPARDASEGGLMHLAKRVLYHMV